ncbi:MAG: prealbumin-like fold domain-containing protein, partial [Methanomassiliicoccales archaeon]|nr:prealbumin-like fold domain-containing protein [Methanomassiliicoccales archaeon]
MVVVLLLAISLSPPMAGGERSTEFAFESAFDVAYGTSYITPAQGELSPTDDVTANADGTVFTVTVSFRYELLDTSDSEVCGGASVELRKLGLASYRTVQEGHTDEEGTIAFKNVSDGTYLVHIETDDDRWVRVHDGNRALASNYYWNTQQFSVSSDRMLDYRISDQTRGAWAIYHDLRDGGEWLWGQTGWQRSQVTVIWPEGDWPHSHGDEIHIPSDEYLADAVWRRDISLHEYAHCVHYELRGGSFPDGDGPDPHYVDSESTPGFAFTEGWAQFFERAVDGDPERIDGTSLESTIFADGPFGNGDDGDMDGSRVEGAVANIFWDIFDGVDPEDRPSGNSRGDNVDRQFIVLWDIMYHYMPEDISDIKRAWPVRTADVQAVFLNARIPMELQPPG